MSTRLPMLPTDHNMTESSSAIQNTNGIDSSVDTPQSLGQPNASTSPDASSSAADAAVLHQQGIAAYSGGHSEEAVALIARAIDLAPSKAHYCITLGRILAHSLMPNQATLAYLRALELAPDNTVILTELAAVLLKMGKQDEARTLLKQASDIQQALRSSGNVSAPTKPPLLPGEPVALAPLVIGGIPFASLNLFGDPNHASLLGLSKDGGHFLKVELRYNPLKKLTLDGERRVMEGLNRQNCVTCPILTGYGTLPHEELERCLTPFANNILSQAPAAGYNYSIQQFIPTADQPSLGDILLAVLEQKSLGIFHADLRPENCRFDAKTGVCYLIDYDQAEALDDATRKLGNLEFFEWCDNLIQEKYRKWDFKTFLHYFPTVDRQRAFSVLFRDGAFDLASTRLFTNQITTASKGGIYHTIREKAAFIEGERSLDSRRGYLDGITFAPGERVLDVGCSSGIVSTYLARRGCKVTGIDLDPQIILGCRILSHILGNDITFLHHDLDSGPVPDEFDTVLLFSVIHHTRNMLNNAAHIAAQSRRIIIECRLEEGGLKPSQQAGWQNTSGWNYSSVEEMVAGLEKLFPGFRLHKNHGQGDRERYVLEFTKAA